MVAKLQPTLMRLSLPVMEDPKIKSLAMTSLSLNTGVVNVGKIMQQAATCRVTSKPIETLIQRQPRSVTFVERCM